MPERDGTRPPPSRDVAGEEFLFHLYRGSEMLQDNRVHDAKAELEQALALQPSDPKGQDLLGIVYFRLGLYPRAIAIYERLIQMHPEAIEPRINLALSYLKTGQPAQARFELEKVVEIAPGHSRAWGYLGLAFQRLGDYERASYAFTAGGHEGMARRLVEMAVSGGALSLRPEAAAPRPTQAPPPPAPAEPFHALDRDPVSLRRGDPEHLPDAGRGTLPPPASAGPRSRAIHAALSVRDPEIPRIAPPPPLVPSIGAGGLLPGPLAPMDGMPASAPLRPPVSPPQKAGDAVHQALLVFPRDLPVAVHRSGVILVQAAHAFATRLDAIRSMAYAAGYGTTMLVRRMRGRASEEPLGGAVSPLIEITGKGELVLAPPEGEDLWALDVGEDPLYLREDVVTGFEPSVAYENGRLPVGDGESVSMVQLRGPGTVVASFPKPVLSIEVSDARSTAIRAVTVLGWVGRVMPRSLLASEAPAGAKGFVAFAGEGMVLIDGR
ncbi:MAG: tetratricopeptide repeat protein [Byssovorax sp.]